MPDIYKIGLLGGIPPALGGGGAEVQMRRTAEALRDRGHEVCHVNEADAGTQFDVVHAFTCEPDLWQVLRHWRRNQCALVVSSVIVVSPGREERLMRIASRFDPMMNAARMRAQILARADHVVALTEYERSVIAKLAPGQENVSVIDNGVAKPANLEPSLGIEGSVVLLGTVTPRKAQAVVLASLGDRFPFIVIGGFEGTDDERKDWEALVARTGADWMGEVGDSATVAATLAGAGALLQFSSAEGQSLAVLEALASGTPVVGSDIPSHRELAARWPGWVRTASSLDAAVAELTAVLETPPTDRPAVPTWHDVAAQLEGVYAQATRHFAARHG